MFTPGEAWFCVSEHRRFAHLPWVPDERGGYPCYLPRAHKDSNYTEGHSIKGGRAPTWLVAKKKKKESCLIKWFNPGLEATALRHWYTEGGDAPGESQPSTEYSDQHLRDTTHKNAIIHFLDLLCSENCAGSLILPTSCSQKGQQSRRGCWWMNTIIMMGYFSVFWNNQNNPKTTHESFPDLPLLRLRFG